MGGASRGLLGQLPEGALRRPRFCLERQQGTDSSRLDKASNQ